MAGYPKAYKLSKKKFKLNEDIPTLSLDDFIELSDDAINHCYDVYVLDKFNKKEIKRLEEFASENFVTVNYREPSKKEIKAAKRSKKKRAKSNVIVKEADVSIRPSTVDSENTRLLPNRDYVVKVIGVPPAPPVEKKRSRIILTPFGPMRESDYAAMPFTPILQAATSSAFYIASGGKPKDEPIVQQAYYNRVALADALAAKLPWQTSVSERNAFKYHICREMSEDEVVNLAVDTSAQHELVKGFTVKK